MYPTNNSDKHTGAKGNTKERTATANELLTEATVWPEVLTGWQQDLLLQMELS